MAFEVASPGKGKKKGRARPDMNVTPLVDVVLVLLIIFMVITPLLAKQFWVHVPDRPEDAQPTPPAPDRESIVVTVDAEGSIHLNREVVAPAELEGRLRRALAASGERTVFFDAASDAPYARAVEALDLCRGGGATTIAVSTQPLVP
jgi:biopolymer transport protein ExbD/biopolymer transport protein TolR